MAFITACSTSLFERLRRWLLPWLLLTPLLAGAGEIEVINPQIADSDDGYVLSADFRFELRSRLEEAVARGLVLTFVVDFEMTRQRWYWFDETVAARSLTYSLSYHALTRQYRLSTGGLHQSFATLDEAVAVLSRLRHWPIIDRHNPAPRPGVTYQAAVRMHLDVSQLPRPFQITALGNRDWNLASDWKTWTMTLPAPAPAPAPAPVPVLAPAPTPAPAPTESK